jgi:hypothetical protein
MPVTTRTAADGRFIISGIRSGTYDLELRRVGFSVGRYPELQVLPGDTVPVTVTMNADGLMLRSVIAGTGVVDRAAPALTTIEPHPAGRCFALMLTERGDSRAFPQTGTIRLDLAPTPSVVGLVADQRLARQFGDPPAAGGAAARGAGRGGGGGSRGSGSAARPNPAPVVSAAWGRLTADSILVRWLVGDGEVTLRLRVISDVVTGTAEAPTHPDRPRPARVSGTLVPCSEP